MLFERKINFKDLPSWQKRGVGFYWENYNKDGATRRRLKVDMELPVGDAYGSFVTQFF